jgi:hypothetical protein
MARTTTQRIHVRELAQGWAEAFHQVDTLAA